MMTTCRNVMQMRYIVQNFSFSPSLPQKACLYIVNIQTTLLRKFKVGAYHHRGAAGRSECRCDDMRSCSDASRSVEGERVGQGGRNERRGAAASKPDNTCGCTSLSPLAPNAASTAALCRVTTSLVAGCRQVLGAGAGHGLPSRIRTGTATRRGAGSGVTSSPFSWRDFFSL